MRFLGDRMLTASSCPGKRLGPSLMIGEEMMSQLTFFDFKVEGNPLMMCREALLHAILSSTKSVDGYSRLIFKSDLDKMKGSLNKKAVEVEQMLRDAWAKCASHTKGGFAFGKLCTRMVLCALAAGQTEAQQRPQGGGVL